jgi:HTH-type transcriptional regulator/antitoxin HigA
MATQTPPTLISLTRGGKVDILDLVIRSKSENERALATVQKLLSRERTPEENALLHVLTSEIASFEDRIYLKPESSPAERLQFLLQENGLTAKDLAGILGGKSHVSETLNGKRRIGVKQAVKLGKRFRMNPAAFLVLE